MTFEELVTHIISNRTPIHITSESALPSIMEFGILSPSEVNIRDLGSCFGSQDSKTDVVQLLDLNELNVNQAVDNINSLFNLNHDLNVFYILTLNAIVRSEPSFASYSEVFTECGGTDRNAIRFFPFTEVWYRDSFLSSEQITEVWKVSRSGTEYACEKQSTDLYSYH